MFFNVVLASVFSRCRTFLICSIVRLLLSLSKSSDGCFLGICFGVILALTWFELKFGSVSMGLEALFDAEGEEDEKFPGTSSMSPIVTF